MKKSIFDMSEEEVKKLSDVCGTSITMMALGHSDVKIAEATGLNYMQVRDNACEMLYILRNYVGKWNFIKMLFRK